MCSCCVFFSQVCIRPKEETSGRLCFMISAPCLVTPSSSVSPRLLLHLHLRERAAPADEGRGQRSALNREGHCLPAGWPRRPMKTRSKQTGEPICRSSPVSPASHLFRGRTQAPPPPLLLNHHSTEQGSRAKPPGATHTHTPTDTHSSEECEEKQAKDNK